MNHSDCNYVRTENFVGWSWKYNKNINNLIQNLNEASGEHDYIRRQKCLPRIYGITIDVSNDWKLCKVGLTRTEGSNRMESVLKELNKKYADRNPSILFKLPVSGTDTRSDELIEKWVRESCGYSVNRKLALWLELNCPTEWVLTPQSFIENIKDRVRNAENMNATLFYSERFDTGPVEDLPLYLENHKNQRNQKVKIEVRGKEIISGRIMHDENTTESLEKGDDSEYRCRNNIFQIREKPQTEYECQVCNNISFLNEYQIDDHVKKEHCGLQWRCRQCGMYFTSPLVLDCADNAYIRDSEGVYIDAKDTLQLCSHPNISKIWEKIVIRTSKRAFEYEDGDDYQCRKRIKPYSEKTSPKRRNSSALGSRNHSETCPCTIL